MARLEVPCLVDEHESYDNLGVRSDCEFHLTRIHVYVPRVLGGWQTRTNALAQTS